MFQTAAGVTVPFPEKLSEQYELDGSTITANLSFEKLSDFVHSFYGELLYQDGLSAFAIGSLTTEEELFVQKYKVLSIYSETAKRFVPLLKKYGMEPTGHLVTAWDTFSEEKPGAAERLEIAGQTVPDMIKELCKIGMYKG